MAPVVVGPPAGGEGGVAGSVDGKGDTLVSGEARGGSVGATGSVEVTGGEVVVGSRTEVAGSWGTLGEGCEGSVVGVVWAESTEVALPSGCVGAGEGGGVMASVVGGIVGGGVCGSGPEIFWVWSCCGDFPFRKSKIPINSLYRVRKVISQVFVRNLELANLNPDRRAHGGGEVGL